MSDTLKNQRAQLPLAKLAIPLFLENILRTALSSVDVVMLSNYNDFAVAAVGLVTTLTFFLIIIYSMVSSGTTVLIAQYLGAGKEREAGDVAVASFALGVVFSIVLSLGMCFGAPSILNMYTLEPEVRNYALQYLVIYSAGSVFVAFNIIQANIMRAYGHAKDSMVSNMIANLLNIGGNALFLYGPEWVPFKGVVGVTLSTVISQAISCVILAVRIKQRKDITIPWADLKKIPMKIYKKLLSIGIPTAGENLAYTIMTIIIGIPISQYGTSALNAHTFLNTVMRFVFMPSFSIGVAGQIKTGYLIGAKMFDKAKKQIFQYFGIGMAISVFIMIVVFLAQVPIFRIFTKDPKVFALLTPILLVCILREIGRVSNIIVIPGLKGSGDVNFPVIVGIISMWGIAAGVGTLLGTVFGLGLIGIWIGIAADELIRGVVMLFRWQSGAWVSKRMVDDVLPPDALLEEQTAVV